MGCTRSTAAAKRLRSNALASYGNGTVPLPPGLDARGLSALMSDLPPQALAGAMAGNGVAITPGMVARGGFDLTARGQGRYELTYGGRQVLDARGAPFLLNLAEAARMPRTADPADPAGPEVPVAPRLRVPTARARDNAPAAPADTRPPADAPAGEPAPPRPSNITNRPIGATMGLGGSNITNRPVGSTITAPRLPGSGR